MLAKLASAGDVAKALDSYNPPQAGFKALKAKLAELRANGGQIAKPADDKPAPVRVPEGKILRPGMKDARVIALRKRLDIAGDKNNPLYDDDVVDAVKAFQTGADLNADGMLGPNTVRALNGGSQRSAPRAEQSDRHRHRQHGALALAAAQARQRRKHLRHGQRAGLHAQADARRQARLEDQDRRRQAGQGDADDSARR